MMDSIKGTLASSIAQELGGRLVGADMIVDGPCSLQRPRPHGLAFLRALALLDGAGDLSQSVVLCPEGSAGFAASCIEVDNPRRAFAVALTKFFAVPRETGIAATAVVAPDVKIGRNVSIGDHCRIGAGCEIGDDTEIRHRVTIAARVRIGARCVIKSGAVIGEEGFGFEKDDEGSNLRIPHVGGVTIGDDVEIGCNTVVCGGTLEPTTIEDHVKIDDLVFIAHNCTIGRNTLIIACAEVSGSAQLGEGVWIGPNATILNKIKLGKRAFIGAHAVVVRDCDENTIYAGVPAKALRLRTEKD